MSGFDKRKLVHGLRNNDVIVPELIMLAEYYSGIAGAVNFFLSRIQTRTQQIETLSFGYLCVEH